MDLGFGAVLDRFEKAFGKLITNLILALIGLATATVCCAIIWKLAVGPVVTWVSDHSISTSGIDEAAKIALFAAGAAGSFWLTSFVTARFERRKVAHLREETQQLLKERDALAAEMQGIDEALDRAGV